jgi:hypothetical protein
MATFYVNSSANDGSYTYEDVWTYTGESLEPGGTSNGSVALEIAVRFSSVNIPQGSTITSATLKGYTSVFSSSADMKLKIYGIDEDNTNDFTSDPRSRDRTTYTVDWDYSWTEWNYESSYTSPSIVNIVQEIVSRPGWSSNNSMGFLIKDDSSPDAGHGFYSYNGDPDQDFELTVTWELPTPTINVYDSSSVTEDRVVTSGSVRTISAKASININRTQTVQAKADIIGEGITPVTRTKTVTARGRVKVSTYGLSVTKPTYDVITDTNPSHYVFDSNYGTLKYHTSGTAQLMLDSSVVSDRVQIEHGLGYIPFVELYTQAYDGSNTWYYVPFYGYGATTMWAVTYTVDSTYINIYVSSGAFLEEVNFNVKYFIFKNDLQFYQSIYVSDKTTATDVVTI